MRTRIAPVLPPSRVSAFAPARAIALALALGSAGVCPAAIAQSAPPATPPPEVHSPNGPVTSPGNAEWADTPDQAKAKASAESKFVFIEFDSHECGNCKRMDALLYPAFDFEALLIPMVPVKVTLESPEGRELARRYSIREAPAVVVATPEGRIIFVMQGFTNAPEFYQHVHRDLADYRAFAKKIESQDIARLPAKEALETGRELFRRADAAAALPRLRRAAMAPNATALIRDDARENLAGVEMELGQTAGSRRTIERLITTTKDPIRRQRAELFRAQLPLAENKPELAVSLFRRFQKEHPDSPYADQVKAMLDRLTAPPPQ